MELTATINPDEASAPRSVPSHRLLPLLGLGAYALCLLAFLPCFMVWMTFAEVLVASEVTEAGLVCLYFTGVGVKARQRPGSPGEHRIEPCPPIVHHDGYGSPLASALAR